MLAFVFDEDLARPLARMAERYNQSGPVHPLDYAAVGLIGGPPGGTKDPGLIAWAEANGRILVSRDKRTMPGHLTRHLATGGHSPGLLLVRSGFPLPEVIETLALIGAAGDADDYRDSWEYIPL